MDTLTKVPCPQARCSRVCKTSQALVRHLATAHNQPRDWFHSPPVWSWAHSDRAIAADSQRTAAINAGKTSRSELAWSEHVDAAVGTGRLVPLAFKGLCRRPDKWYIHRRSAEADECDERQNDRGVGTRELARLRRLQAVCGKPLCVIRWNPDRYDGPKVSMADRLALFVRLKLTLRRRAKMARRLPRIEVWYMFYSKTNQSICPGVPVHFVNAPADLPRYCSKSQQVAASRSKSQQKAEIFTMLKPSTMSSTVGGGPSLAIEVTPTVSDVEEAPPPAPPAEAESEWAEGHKETRESRWVRPTV